MNKPLSSLRCETCGCSALIAVAVGRDELRAPGGILIQTAIFDRGWCIDHWPTMRGRQEELFSQPAGVSQ